MRDAHVHAGAAGQAPVGVFVDEDFARLVRASNGHREDAAAERAQLAQGRVGLGQPGEVGGGEDARPLAGVGKMCDMREAGRAGGVCDVASSTREIFSASCPWLIIKRLRSTSLPRPNQPWRYGMRQLRDS